MNEESMNERSTNEPTPLSAALDQIAAGAASTHDARSATGAGLDVTAARAAARRRRTRYGAVTGLAAAAVVAAVALGGSALLRDDRPLPPVDSPTDGPTTTSTPSPTDDAWPPAVTLDGAVPGCGDPMPALVVPEGESEITIERVTQGAPLVAGGVAELDVTIHAPEGFGLQGNLPQPLLVRDGVVVATLGRDVDLSAVYSTSTELGFPPVLLDLVRCETQGRGAVPLDAGSYDLYVVDELSRPAADPAEAPERLGIVGGPYPVALEAADDSADQHLPLADLSITTEGLGPLALGDAVTSAALIRSDPLACEGTDNPQRWVADYDDGRNAVGGPDAPFLVQTSGGEVIRIDVMTPGPHTTRGIQVGSTLEEVLAAHPEFTLLATADELGEVEAWGVVVGDHTLAVEVAANPADGQAWTDAALLGRVVAIVASALPYTAPAWGSDVCG